jgi:DNA polymerase IV (archaeal DinB-like DNA polymerase)
MRFLNLPGFYHYVVVGADPKRGKGQGVVCTCSYEAREYGIHSAMPVSQAYKLCPDATFLPVNIRLYVQFSENIKISNPTHREITF